MKIRVDFYLLEQDADAAQARLACRIIDKAYRQGYQVYVLCTDTKQVEYLDKFLWTFDEISFLPHKIWQKQKELIPDSPILIGDQTVLPSKDYAILVNLRLDVPDFFAQFQRVIEIVSANTDARANARERYRIYRSHDTDLHSHKL